MPRLTRFLLGLGLCLTASNVFAQSAVVELYGEGVHRFFAGNLFEAELYFTRVIESGVEDPRAYYFRGLVREHQGGGGEYDFETAARLEAEGSRSFDIASALTRIQGHTRAKIEKYRLDARVAAQQQRLLMERAKADAANAVPAQPVAPVAPAVQPVVPDVDATDPFGSEAGTTSGEPTVDSVQPVVPEVESTETTDPFADVPAPATPPSTTEPADPFGDVPAPTETDPFGNADAGTGAPGLDDPFAN